jgi:hypothetical protein
MAAPDCAAARFTGAARTRIVTVASVADSALRIVELLQILKTGMNTSARALAREAFYLGVAPRPRLVCCSGAENSSRATRNFSSRGHRTASQVTPRVQKFWSPTASKEKRLALQHSD